MTILFAAFSLTLLTSMLCIAAVLTHWLRSVAPATTSCFMMLIPAAIAAAPFLFHPRSKARIGAAYVAALLLFGWVVLTGFSVGMFYLPATAMMAIAAVRMAVQMPTPHSGNHLDNSTSAAPSTLPLPRS